MNQKEVWRILNTASTDDLFRNRSLLYKDSYCLAELIKKCSSEQVETILKENHTVTEPCIYLLAFDKVQSEEVRHKLLLDVKHSKNAYVASRIYRKLNTSEKRIIRSVIAGSMYANVL